MRNPFTSTTAICSVAAVAAEEVEGQLAAQVDPEFQAAAFSLGIDNTCGLRLYNHLLFHMHIEYFLATRKSHHEIQRIDRRTRQPGAGQ